LNNALHFFENRWILKIIFLLFVFIKRNIQQPESVGDLQGYVTMSRQSYGLINLNRITYVYISVKEKQL